MTAKCYFCDAAADSEGNEPFICKDCYNEREKELAARRVWEARQELKWATKELLKVKHKDEPRYIANVFVFSNGNTAVFDQFQDQMPEYQGIWGDVRYKIFAQVEKQDKKPIFNDNYGTEKVTL